MNRALPLLTFAGIALVSVLGACSSDGSAEVRPVTNDVDGGTGPGESDPAEAAAPVDDAGLSPTLPFDGGNDAATPPAKNYALGKSAGCGKAGAATGLQTRTMTIAGKVRSYVRFIPAGYQPNKALAVVLGFHGSGGSSVKARGQFDLEQQAAGKAIFIYPQGLPDPAFDDANRWDPTKGSDDFTFLDALMSEIETSHCVDRDRVFATGFSNGARMTSMIGCYRGDKIRAIAPVAPGGDATTLPLAGCVGEVGIWEGLGNEDAEHEPGATRVRDYYRVANGCGPTRKATTPAGCEAYVGCRTEVPSVWCAYPGGHAWPPIGSAGVWSFFASFP